jgi:hypothetical protein
LDVFSKEQPVASVDAISMPSRVGLYIFIPYSFLSAHTALVCRLGRFTRKFRKAGGRCHCSARGRPSSITTSSSR